MSDDNNEKPEIKLSERMAKILDDNEGAVIIMAKGREKWDRGADHIETKAGDHYFWQEQMDEFGSEYDSLISPDDDDYTIALKIPGSGLFQVVNIMNSLADLGLSGGTLNWPSDPVIIDRDLSTLISSEYNESSCDTNISEDHLSVKVHLKHVDAYISSRRLNIKTMMESKMDPDCWVYESDDPQLKREDTEQTLEDETSLTVNLNKM